MQQYSKKNEAGLRAQTCKMVVARALWGSYLARFGGQRTDPCAPGINRDLASPIYWYHPLRADVGLADWAKRELILVELQPTVDAWPAVEVAAHGDDRFERSVKADVAVKDLARARGLSPRRLPTVAACACWRGFSVACDGQLGGRADCLDRHRPYGLRGHWHARPPQSARLGA
eukprot:scaffold268797_cov32-Tisochrysis_lutea.AAC.1